ncbi:S-layer homology domain-containing protein [Paenibacillus sp. FSL R7-0652]|uniref:S-layer homology domain-containing protein n=1 Tax=Paenibacillus sp. FSL R7-0652 TaxID=2921687 RepID=UPI00315AF31F
MQQKKRPLVWIMLVTMVLSLFPQGLFGGAVASAADEDIPSTASYFIPDLKTLRDTSDLTIDSANAGKVFLTRDKAFVTKDAKITVTGTFSGVSTENMRASVEQLTLNSSNTKWTVDAGRTRTGSVIADAGSQAAPKFTATLDLFPGFNQVTLTGRGLNNVERSNTFYVLYEETPLIEKMTVTTDFTTGNGQEFNLNGVSETVVDTKSVTFGLTLQNASRVSLSINGGTKVDAFPTQTSDVSQKFFTPPLELASGKNKVVFDIVGPSSAMTVERTLYYFDKNQSFADLQISIGGEKKSVLNTQANFSAPGTSAKLSGQIIVPYSTTAFDEAAGIEVNNETYPVKVDPSKEILITGANGVDYQYRMITFEGVGEFDLAATGGKPNRDQPLKVVAKYGSFNTGYTGEFTYSTDSKDITNIYYLPGYTSGPVNSKVLLNKTDYTKVSEDTFYILVESSQNIKGAAINGKYLPSLTVPLKVDAVTGTDTGLNDNQQIYKVEKMAGGQQKISFFYGDASKAPELPYVAWVSFASSSSIYIENLQDGQTFSFNSGNSSAKLEVIGKYLDFRNVDSSGPKNGFKSELQVNGKVEKPTSGFPIESGNSFKFNLGITKDGPLGYGQNIIRITATDADEKGAPVIITRTLTIYIIDENVSTIDSFMPTAVPKSTNARAPFYEKAITSYTPEEMNNIFAVTPDFAFKENKYVTSEDTYDLVFRGGGAQVANVYFGSELIFRHDQTGTLTLDLDKEGPAPQLKKFDFAGNERQFIARIKNLKFDSPGTQVFTLELINSTGARTTQRLEIVREPSSFRIVAPQPTVGDKIVVNKNYIRFDIEAEGASRVLVDKKPAAKRTDMNNRYIYDYVGLKPDKENKIKISIERDGSTINETINVFYTGAVTVDSQFMAPKVANKYTVFNKGLTLTFPKGTILQAKVDGGTKFYPDNKILFGIADPLNGVLERKNDYGNVMNIDRDMRTVRGESAIALREDLISAFSSTNNTGNFTLISNVYWINGGLGELNNLPYTDGIPPYSIYGYYPEYPTSRILAPSQRGSLTLQYDPSIVDEVGSTISVFRYTDISDQKQWVPIGGVVDTKGHTITVPFDEFGYYKVMKQSKSFQDITNHPWARNILNALYSKGVMKALRTGEFGADDQTTRGEFATLLVKGLNIPLNYDVNKQTFIDVSKRAEKNAWSFAAIETAARAGIVQGLSDGYFGVEDRITREQAAVMIARAMSSKLATNDSKLASTLAKSFQDSGSIEYYARPSVQAITKAKIMEGSPVTVTGSTKKQFQFNPKGNLTRAEAAKIAVELLKKSTKLFPKNLS